jgi:hypothetical protein
MNLHDALDNDAPPHQCKWSVFMHMHCSGHYMSVQTSDEMCAVAHLQELDYSHLQGIIYNHHKNRGSDKIRYPLS